MKKTNASGHSSNQYSEGNAALGVPATVVDSKSMNMIQNEICNVVEAANIQLVSPDTEPTDPEWDDAQLVKAIGVIAKSARLKTNIENFQATFTPLLDQQGNESIILDKTIHKSAVVEFDIYRTDLNVELNAIGRLSIGYKPKTDTYKIIGMFFDQDSNEVEHGVEFKMINKLDGSSNPTNEWYLAYKSTDLNGGSYIGQMTYSLSTFLNN